MIHQLAWLDLAWKLRDVVPFAIELMLIDNDKQVAAREERKLDEELGCLTNKVPA